ncbi:MAG: DNA-binding protein [Capnocytophaga sp.]|nr:DNA-binding protein [Capnocytophaga sp.]
MKKILLLGLALTVLASCKDDETGIPPVQGGQQQQQQGQNANVLEASKATVADYQDGKAATIKGNIVRQGNYSYFKFSDGTLVQIFAYPSVVQTLSEDTKKKLATAGQEVTVKGKFKDYKLKNGNVVKEIVYEKESDLTFGNVTTPSDENVTELDASKATATDYIEGKKVKLKGVISVESGKSYIKFSDQTSILLYSVKSVFDALGTETKTKLKTNGQALTVTGTFKNYTPKGSNDAVKQIVYEKESDLVFGDSTTPTPPSDTTVTELDASKATVTDYIEGKKVKLTGTISVKNSRSYLNFSDGTEIQVYVNGYKSLDQSIQTKLNTVGQKLTATGTFKTYNSIKQIQVASGSDLVFGEVVPQDNNNQGGNQNGNQSGQGGNDNGSGNQGDNNSSTTHTFDFENLVVSGKKGYAETGELTLDGVTLTYQARTDMDKYAINGKGLMLSGNNHKDSHIKIVFPKGVKEISFDYKPGFTSKAKRHLIIYEGDENSKTELDKIDFSEGAKYTKTLNKTSSFTITIKTSSSSNQVVIDNFSWK